MEKALCIQQKLKKHFSVPDTWDKHDFSIHRYSFDDLLEAAQLIMESDLLRSVDFSSLKNKLVVELHNLKEDTRMSFEDSSEWSHKITAINAKLELIEQIEKGI